MKTRVQACLHRTFPWLILSFLASTAVGQQTQPPAGQTGAGNLPSQSSPAQEVRFAVAHQHSFSWCYGYLYVSPDTVHYEVVQPQSSRNHSFSAPRGEVTVRQWTLLGQPQDVVELKVKGATYHMRWLANEAEVNTGSAKRMSPPQSAAPDTLIAAVQNPAPVQPAAPVTVNAAAAAPAPAAANSAIAALAPPVSAPAATGGDPAPGTNPPDTQFGNFLFKMPNGWRPQEKGDAMLIFAPAPLPGSTTIIALRAKDLTGDLPTSFNQLWNAYQTSYRVLQGGQIARLHSNQGYDGYSTTAVVTDQGGGQWNLVLMGVQYGKRLQSVVFMSDIPPGNTYNIYLDTFQKFLANLSFGDALSGSHIPTAGVQPVQEPAPQVPAGMLQGVYVCTAGGDAKPTNKQFIFYPDGFMMNGLPQEGMLGFDFDRYRNQDNPTKNWIGRYRLEGDQVKIVWQNQFADPSNPYVIKINEKSAHPAFELGWDTFIPVCRCTGKTFSGKYQSGLPQADQYIQFFADGTFVDHRATDQMLIPNPFYEHPRIQRGTYSIESQTMIFHFADGHRGTRTFVAPKAEENEPVFDWIGLGRQVLFEEHYLAQLSR